jgi:hypothetical protein
MKQRKGISTRRITKADIESVRNELKSTGSVTQELLAERKKERIGNEKRQSLKGAVQVVSQRSRSTNVANLLRIRPIGELKWKHKCH